MATSKLILVMAAALLLAVPVGEEEPAESEPAVKGFVGPQVILGTQQPPEFPPAAWDARYTGSVSLEVTVLEDGTVGEVNVIGCTRPRVGFEERAVQAVKKWRFEPGTNDGIPVEVTTRLRLNFTRVRVGQNTEPQVSAGSFTVAAIDRGSASPPPASDPK